MACCTASEKRGQARLSSSTPGQQCLALCHKCGGSSPHAGSHALQSRTPQKRGGGGGAHKRPPLLAAPQHVSYTVVNSQNKKETIKLLDDILGYLRPGELVALVSSWVLRGAVSPPPGC